MLLGTRNLIFYQRLPIVVGFGFPVTNPRTTALIKQCYCKSRSRITTVGTCSQYCENSAIQLIKAVIAHLKYMRRKCSSRRAIGQRTFPDCRPPTSVAPTLPCFSANSQLQRHITCQLRLEMRQSVPKHNKWFMPPVSWSLLACQGSKPGTRTKSRQPRHDSQPASQRVFVFASANRDEQVPFVQRLCRR